MKVAVVYESLWGNTARIAEAIAEGIGPEAEAMPPELATSDALHDVDLIVAGSPVLGFALPTDAMRAGLPNTAGAPSPPDLTHASLRSWLDGLGPCDARCAAFETRVRGPWGQAKSTIQKRLVAAGCTPVAEPEGFVVSGKFGPLRDGEVERARAWGARLRAQLEAG